MPCRLSCRRPSARPQAAPEASPLLRPKHGPNPRPVPLAASGFGPQKRPLNSQSSPVWLEALSESSRLSRWSTPVTPSFAYSDRWAPAALFPIFISVRARPLLKPLSKPSQKWTSVIESESAHVFCDWLVLPRFPSFGRAFTIFAGWPCKQTAAFIVILLAAVANRVPQIRNQVFGCKIRLSQ